MATAVAIQAQQLGGGTAFPKVYSQKQVLQYLSSLPHSVLSLLYQGQWNEYACQAVFRALSSQARMYVMRALGGEAISESALAWRGSVRIHEAALDSLLGLSIFQVRDVSKAASQQGQRTARTRPSTSFQISAAFVGGLKQALIMDDRQSDDLDVTANQRRDRIEQLAAEQWNAVLSFLVSSSGGVLGGDSSISKDDEGGGKRQRQTKKARMSTTPTLSPTTSVNLDSAVQSALRTLGFVSDTDEGQQITSTGYEFMLKEVYEQVFILVQHFVSNLELALRAPTLRFLFYISFLAPGHEIEVQPHVLPSESIAFFESIGLICRQDGNGNRYAVSSLGVHAIFGLSSQKKLFSMNKSDSLTQDAVDDLRQHHQKQQQQRIFGLGGMRIIVETTFKVFCYTASPMHAQMLQLFCQIEARLPNLVVAMITRESVGEAFKKGISDEQLISFLQQNAHPLTYSSRYNIVPDNVTDQIRLWKRELNRINVNYGRLFVMNELQATLYDSVVKHQELEPFVPWRDDIGKRLFVTNEGYNLFKDICNKARQSLMGASS